MRKFKKIFGRLLIAIVVIIIGIVAYIKLFLPNVGAAPALTVERTAGNVARGEYLANHVTICIDCHSTRDWTRYSGPIADGTVGMGGELFDQKFGFPGAYYAKNITPEGISRYTDGELFRIITTGVNKDGKAIFPVMPYHNYGKMDEEDIKCIIAYIRTLKPIKNAIPESSSDFPMSIIINTIPQKANLTKRPAETDVVNYGKYLVTAAACMDCHTQFEKGKQIAGTEFGGGREFPFPDGSKVRSANITPHTTTGIGRWTEEVFLSYFHSRSDSAALARKIQPGEVNTIMPWTMYGKMKDGDLKAIYAYLKTVKPLDNAVEKFSKAAAK
ncbi:MAG: c-type cytochrome [Bacteroidota bacterium]